LDDAIAFIEISVLTLVENKFKVSKKYAMFLPQSSYPFCIFSFDITGSRKTAALSITTHKIILGKT
jgi:hypothetical protein